MITWLSNYWEIKLVSLILAVVIYAFTGAAISISERITVEFTPEMVAGLPDDRRVMSFEPAMIELELSGPSDILSSSSLTLLQPSFEFDSERLEDDRIIYDVSSRLLRLHPDLRWDFVNAEQAIHIRFDRTVTETFVLSVPPERILLPKIGAELRQVQPDRGTIDLTGPESVIERLLTERLPVAEVDLSRTQLDVSSPTELLQVPFQLQLPDGVIADGGPRFTATVVLDPIWAERDVLVPVELQASPEFFANMKSICDLPKSWSNYVHHKAVSMPLLTVPI